MRGGFIADGGRGRRGGFLEGVECCMGGCRVSCRGRHQYDRLLWHGIGRSVQCLGGGRTRCAVEGVPALLTPPTLNAGPYCHCYCHSFPGVPGHSWYATYPSVYP